MSSFYTVDELDKIGFKSLGENVLISKKASIYAPEKMIIGNNVRIDDFCTLSGEITIGNYVHISSYCALYGGMGIEVKDFAGISSRSVVYSVTDDYSGEFLTNPTVPNKFRNVIGGKVTLERHSLVGSGCTILPNVTIGEGTSTGAMSLITKSLDEWSIYVGIPAKRIKDRSKKILELEKQFLNETNQ